MATLCRERYFTREEMRTQYKKAEKQKNEGVICSATLRFFVCLNLVLFVCLSCSSEARTLVYDKHAPKCLVFNLTQTYFKKFLKC